MHKILLFVFLFLCCGCILMLVESKTSTVSEASCPKKQEISIGVVIDQTSRVGREQKIAMELAVEDYNHCLNMVLHIKDTHGNPARAASAATDLVTHHQVDAIVGTITRQDASFISDFKTRNIPIISLSPSPSAPQQTPLKSQSFMQMGTPIAYQMQCMAAIIRNFRWRKVILMQEQSEDQAGLFTHLSDSLQAVDSSIDYYSSFPRISTLLDPKAFIEQELRILKTKNVKVFVVMQSSLEFALILFDKAKELEMMAQGHVWIVSDEIANLLDSLDSSAILNMQGVVGLKTDYKDTSENFRDFKSRFRRKYASKYPSEEENSGPSIYSSRAYDAVRALSQRNSTGLLNRIDFEGLSGKISFKNGLLSKNPVFRAVNVIGKSYREVGLWSPEFGFHDGINLLNSIYWPGGSQTVPKGWAMGSKEKPLRIGVPAKGAFNQFVKVTYDPGVNKTRISGFSIEVFEAARKRLPYDLHSVFVPYNGSYDEMVGEVHNKSLDAAVGDTEIMADRYALVEFSQPYIESGLVMVVTVKAGLRESRFIALNAFTKKMWIQLAALSMSTGLIIWLIEYATGNEQFTKKPCFEIMGSVLWLSVTLMSFSQRENIKNNASKLVLAAWICVVFVVGASFTAVLSSMMTVPRLQPSIMDIDYLLNTNAAVGCNWNSFIVRYLTDVLHFKPENVRKVNSINEYPKHFQKGDIKAAFFVAPHANVFLAKYCKGYIISGPTVKLGGFGFIFPKGTPLAIDISEAILRVKQSGHVNKLEKNMLHNSSCTSSTSKAEADDLKLGPEPFSGLFMILGAIIGVACFITIIRFVREKYCSISIYDLVLKALIMKRISEWASMVLTDYCTRFGSTFFRKEIVLDEQIMDVQMAVNHREIQEYSYHSYRHTCPR